MADLLYPRLHVMTYLLIIHRYATPTEWKIEPNKVDYISELNETVLDMMVSPLDPNMTMYVVENWYTNQTYILLGQNNQLPGALVNYPVAFVSVSEADSRAISGKSVSSTTTSRQSHVISNGPAAEGRAPLIYDTLGVQSPVTNVYVVLRLLHIYTISLIEFYPHTSPSYPLYLQDERYVVYSSTTQFMPLSRDWMKRGLFRKLPAAPRFFPDGVVPPFRCLMMMIKSLGNTQMVIEQIIAVGHRDSTKMVKHITHCGPDHMYYYLARGSCISRRLFINRDPYADPEVLVGECFPATSRLNSTDGHFSFATLSSVRSLTCDPVQKILFFTDEEKLRMFNISGFGVRTIQGNTEQFAYNPITQRLYIIEGSLQQKLKFFSKRISPPVMKSIIYNSRNSSGYRDGDLGGRARFSLITSLVHLKEDLFLLADTDNHVLRLIQGLPESNVTIKVFSVCDALSQKTNATDIYTDLSNYTSLTCTLHMPTDVYTQGSKIFVTDSVSDGTRSRVTSYYFKKCVALLPVLHVSEEDSMLKWLVEDDCQPYLLLACTVANDCLNKTYGNRQVGTEVTEQLSSLHLGAKSQLNITVWYGYSPAYSVSIFWPTKFLGNLTLTVRSRMQTKVVTTKGIDYNSTMTVRDGRRYTITCEIITPHPITNIKLKLTVNCDEVTSPDHVTYIRDDIGRPVVKRVKEIKGYQFDQRFDGEPIPIYCGANWSVSPQNIFTPQLVDTLKVALLHVKVYKEGCVAREVKVQDVGQEDESLVQNFWFSQKSEVTFANITNSCAEKNSSLMVRQCSRAGFSTSSCTDCDKYCQPVDQYSIDLQFNRQNTLLYWPIKAHCFLSYTRKICLRSTDVATDGDCLNTQVTISNTDSLIEKVLAVDRTLAEQVNYITVELTNITNDGRPVRSNEVVYPNNADIPGLSLTLATDAINDVSQGNPDATLMSPKVVTVSPSSPTTLQCSIRTFAPVKDSIEFKMYIGCEERKDAVKSTSRRSDAIDGVSDVISYEHLIESAGLYLRRENATVGEYLPVLCEWRWVVSNAPPNKYLRRTLLHIKLVDPADEHYNESLADSKVSPSWFQYQNGSDVATEVFQQQCQRKSEIFSRDNCIMRECTDCEKYYSPCLHGGSCEETDLSCDCTLAAGYTGDNCEEVEESCTGGRLQCLFGGKCTNTTTPPSCICQQGFSGPTCALNDACNPNPCNYDWLTCIADGSGGHVCNENNYVKEQITTKIKCEADATLCARTIASSVCHPLGFCYCPDGTVLTSVRNETNGKLAKQCVLGEVKCRNQLDCIWVVDDNGETICVEKKLEGDDYNSVRESSCRCFDETRVNNVTGRCLKVKQVVVDQSTWIDLIPWWGWLLAVLAFLLIILMIYAVVRSYRQQYVNPKLNFNLDKYNKSKKVKDSHSRSSSRSNSKPKDTEGNSWLKYANQNFAQMMQAAKDDPERQKKLQAAYDKSMKKKVSTKDHKKEKLITSAKETSERSLALHKTDSVIYRSDKEITDELHKMVLKLSKRNETNTAVGLTSEQTSANTDSNEHEGKDHNDAKNKKEGEQIYSTELNKMSTANSAKPNKIQNVSDELPPVKSDSKTGSLTKEERKPSLTPSSSRGSKVKVEQDKNTAGTPKGKGKNSDSGQDQNKPDGHSPAKTAENSKTNKDPKKIKNADTEKKKPTVISKTPKLSVADSGKNAKPKTETAAKQTTNKSETISKQKKSSADGGIKAKAAIVAENEIDSNSKTTGEGSEFKTDPWSRVKDATGVMSSKVKDNNPKKKK